MESPLQKVSRLVGALESLLDQASCLLSTRDYPGAIAVQDRCQPVIDEIYRLMVEPGLARLVDPTTRTRLDQLLKRQLTEVDRISVDKQTVREELQTIRVAQSRTQRFRLAYGRAEDLSSPSKYAESG